MIEINRDKILGEGIAISKGETLVLYGEIEIWFNYMKRWSIQQGFANTYKILEKIGKGNQAEVLEILYRCIVVDIKWEMKSLLINNIQKIN